MRHIFLLFTTLIAVTGVGCGSYGPTASQKLSDMFWISGVADDERGLTDDDARVRRWSVMRLAARGSIETSHKITWLVSRKREEDPAVRAAAAVALRQLDCRQAAPYLARNIDDPDPLVRREIVRSLGALGSGEQIPDLAKLLNPLLEPPDIRRAAISAIAQIGGNSGLPHLIDALDDPDESVRAADARALATLVPEFSGATKKDWLAWWDSRPKEPQSAPASPGTPINGEQP